MSYIRLNIIVEGHTELRFVKEVLAPHLAAFQVYATARPVMTSKDKRKTHRGGLISYEKARKDIFTWLKEDKNPEVRFSTMFDLYALPKDFPDYEDAQKINAPYQKIAFLEKALASDIDDHRFIPYLQLHEFEALVLANPRNLEWEFFEREDAVTELERQLETAKGNPELLNEGRETAPSKRIIKLIPEYEDNKASSGVSVVDLTGMEFLKERCNHFNSWVSRLEELADETSDGS